MNRFRLAPFSPAMIVEPAHAQDKLVVGTWGAVGQTRR
jgi:hypothetical protein